ncbi:MAG: radical SAM protein [Anaerolineales bacterium]
MHDCSSPSLTAIVKPTYACNLACLYCYEGGRSQPCERMGVDTLRNVITKLAQYHGPERTTRIIWHGGEPLLMGLDFFRTAVKIQQEMGSDYKFDNSIQTNGTLLTDEVLDFCQEHNFSIGTSLDGPQWLHDFTRPYSDGRSSFVDILQAVSRMRERRGKESQHSIGGGVIAILTKPVLPHLDEFYEFFRDNRINVKINPIFYTGRGATVRDKLGITPLEYGEAMVYLFDRWFYEPEHVIDIDPFDLVLGNLMTGEPWGCQFGPACYDEFIAVDPIGNVHPCGRWSSEESFCMGNLNEQDMWEIRQSPVLEQFRQGRMRAILKCRDCEFRPICNAGCVENGYLVRQRLSDRDIYCAGYKKMFRHIREALLGELDKVTVLSDSAENGRLVTVLDRLIDVQRVQNPALQRVLENRVLNFSTRAMDWKDHNRWEEHYPDYKVHNKYPEYKVYFEYKEYRETYSERWNQRWNEYRCHSDYYDSSPMC